MILSVEREESFNGGIAEEPEEDRREEPQGALIFILHDLFQTSNDIVALSLDELFRFFDEQQDHQRGKKNQARPNPEWQAGVELVHGTASQESDDTANAAHEVDDAVRL